MEAHHIRPLGNRPHDTCARHRAKSFSSTVSAMPQEVTWPGTSRTGTSSFSHITSITVFKPSTWGKSEKSKLPLKIPSHYRELGSSKSKGREFTSFVVFAFWLWPPFPCVCGALGLAPRRRVTRALCLTLPSQSERSTGLCDYCVPRGGCVMCHRVSVSDGHSVPSSRPARLLQTPAWGFFYGLRPSRMWPPSFPAAFHLPSMTVFSEAPGLLTMCSK